MGSYLQCRQNNGEWLVRIEDLDPPREVPGASAAILRSLEAHGFEWDDEVCWQSQRSGLYLEAIASLKDKGQIFACRCSRRDLESALAKRDGQSYPGTCRHKQLQDDGDAALRFQVAPGTVCFEDLLQGRICQDVSASCGDFVVRRRDGLFAYQLAVVVDDAEQAVTQVVRGCDLLDSTPRQILLQKALGFPTPSYLHLPVVTADDEEKLSKQNGARALDDARAIENLIAAARLLRQPIGSSEDFVNTRDLWAQLTAKWDPAPLEGLKKVAAAAADRA